MNLISFLKCVGHSAVSPNRSSFVEAYMRLNRGLGRVVRVARVVLLGALISVACVQPTTLAHTYAGSEAEEAATAARATLARLPTETRLGEISNEHLRRVVQATYRAVVELAENRDPGKLTALNSKFERAYSDVERETRRGEHKTCAANCKALDGDLCQADCKATGKKFCGCKLIVFGCIVAECIF